MATWEKPSQETIDLFTSIIPDDPKIEKRKMFGYPCCFYQDNMFIGVHNNNIILRLSEQDRQTFIRDYDAKIFEPMPGRKMKEYCTIPKNILGNIHSIKEWVEKSERYAASLPKKIKKKK